MIAYIFNRITNEVVGRICESSEENFSLSLLAAIPSNLYGYKLEGRLSKEGAGEKLYTKGIARGVINQRYNDCCPRCGHGA